MQGFTPLPLALVGNEGFIQLHLALLGIEAFTPLLLALVFCASCISIITDQFLKTLFQRNLRVTTKLTTKVMIKVTVKSRKQSRMLRITSHSKYVAPNKNAYIICKNRPLSKQTMFKFSDLTSRYLEIGFICNNPYLLHCCRNYLIYFASF